MNVTRLLSAPLSRGLVLCILGFLIVIPSYFLLPVGITKSCSELCPTLNTPKAMGGFLHESLTPPTAPWATLFTLVPLFMIVLILLLGLLYARQQQRLLLRWFLSSWIVGLISFLLFTIAVFIFYNPAVGFFGMVLGYALFFGGYRTFIVAAPQQESLPIAPTA